jgi:hypothetical protein
MGILPLALNTSTAVLSPDLIRSCDPRMNFAIQALSRLLDTSFKPGPISFSVLILWQIVQFLSKIALPFMFTATSVVESKTPVNKRAKGITNVSLTTLRLIDACLCIRRLRLTGYKTQQADMQRRLHFRLPNLEYRFIYEIIRKTGV